MVGTIRDDLFGGSCREQTTGVLQFFELLHATIGVFIVPYRPEALTCGNVEKRSSGGSSQDRPADEPATSKLIETVMRWAEMVMWWAVVPYAVRRSSLVGVGVAPVLSAVRRSANRPVRAWCRAAC